MKLTWRKGYSKSRSNHCFRVATLLSDVNNNRSFCPSGTVPSLVGKPRPGWAGTDSRNRFACRKLRRIRHASYRATSGQTELFSGVFPTNAPLEYVSRNGLSVFKSSAGILWVILNRQGSRTSFHLNIWPLQAMLSGVHGCRIQHGPFTAPVSPRQFISPPCHVLCSEEIELQSHGALRGISMFPLWGQHLMSANNASLTASESHRQCVCLSVELKCDHPIPELSSKRSAPFIVLLRVVLYPTYCSCRSSAFSVRLKLVCHCPFPPPSAPFVTRHQSPICQQYKMAAGQSCWCRQSVRCSECPPRAGRSVHLAELSARVIAFLGTR